VVLCLGLCAPPLPSPPQALPPLPPTPTQTITQPTAATKKKPKNWSTELNFRVNYDN
jgi:hypothetical protein